MLPSLILPTFPALLPLSAALQTGRRSQHVGNSSDIRRDLPLDVPLRLYSVKRPIDGSWQSLSIEFSYMADYFGNLTYLSPLLAHGEIYKLTFGSQDTESALI